MFQSPKRTEPSQPNLRTQHQAAGQTTQVSILPILFKHFADKGISLADWKSSKHPTLVSYLRSKGIKARGALIKIGLSSRLKGERFELGLKKDIVALVGEYFIRPGENIRGHVLNIVRAPGITTGLAYADVIKQRKRIKRARSGPPQLPPVKVRFCTSFSWSCYMHVAVLPFFNAEMISGTISEAQAKSGIFARLSRANSEMEAGRRPRGRQDVTITEAQEFVLGICPRYVGSVPSVIYVPLMDQLKRFLNHKASNITVYG